nr:hypothetical protein [Methanobrevibacter arboriphilus]
MTTEKTIKLSVEVSAEELESLGISIDKIEDSSIKIDADASEAKQELEEFHNRVETIREDGTIDIRFENDAGQTIEEVEELNSKLDELDNKTVKPDIDGSGVDDYGNETEEAAQNTDLLSGAISGLTALGIASFLWEAAEAASAYSDSIDVLSIASEDAGVSLDQSKKTASGIASELGIAGSAARKFTSDLELMGVTNQSTIKGLATSSRGLAFLVGDSTDSVTQKFEKMIATGKVMPRTFGTSWGLIQKSIEESGMSVDEWKAKFESATQPERAEMLNEALSKSSAIQKGAADAADSLDAKMQRLNNSIGGVVRRLGEPILNAIVPILQGIAWAVDMVVGAWDSLPQPVKDFLSGIVLIVGVAGGMIAFLGFLLSVLPAITTAIGAVSTMFQLMAAGEFLAAIGASGLWAALVPILTALAPFIAIAIAIVGIAIAIQELGKYMGWWTDWGTMLEAFKAGILRLWSAFTNNKHVKAIIEWLKEAWQGLMDFLKPVFDAIGDWWSSLFPDDGGEFDIVRGIIDLFGWLGDSLAWLWDIISNNPIADFILWFFSMVNPVTVIMGIINSLIFIFQTLWTVGSFIISGLQIAWNIFSGVLSSIINTIKSTVQGFLDKVNAVKNGISSAVESIKKIFSGIYDTIKTMVDNSIGKLKELIGWKDKADASGGAFDSVFKFNKYDFGDLGTGSGDTYITNNNIQGIVDKYAVDLINKTRNEHNNLDKSRRG